MSTDWDRRVIPRWRNSALSSLLPETRPTVEEVSPNSFLASQKEKLSVDLLLWKANPSFGGAADLLNYAHISLLRPLLVDPARYIQERQNNVPDILKAVANSILNIEQEAYGHSLLQNRQEIFRLHARNIKRRLYLDPKNSIALVDLARIYAAQGQREQASFSINKALSLNPNHRFILRAGARFYVHNNQPEVALDIIERSQRTLQDPWLMATHISLETILGKTPKFIKKANLVINAGHLSPLHISELASSIGTFRVMNGDIKVGKRHFHKALIAPNDNVVAQALWAAHRFDITLDVRDELLLNPFSHEARYYQYIQNADFELAIKEASDWFDDEPFASRPLRAATYICCVLGHYEMAEHYARQGLLINSTDSELRNNLIYALSAQDKLAEAVPILSEVMREEKSNKSELSGHSLANFGMVLFRLGLFEGGERFYKAAITKFATDKDTLAQAQAAAFMARESHLSRNPEAARLAAEAIELISIYPSKAALKILEMSEFLSNYDEPKKRPYLWRYDHKNHVLLINNESLKLPPL